jgi:hypothetical protein
MIQTANPYNREATSLLKDSISELRKCDKEAFLDLMSASRSYFSADR